MSAERIAARLAELGLRIPAEEFADFAALVADMEQAAAAARQPLPYRCEPASTFALQPATPG